MSRIHSYLNTCDAILSQYSGEIPFAPFIRKFFAASRKYGSRDRRTISQLCYVALRLGPRGKTLSSEERVLTGLFLCSDTSHEVLAELRPEWNAQVIAPLPEKLAMLGKDFSLQAVFPWFTLLSGNVSPESFVLSHFLQPDLFLRIRPGWEEHAVAVLRKSGLLFSREGSCIRLPNGTRLEELFELDRMVVVQDKNSQRLGEYYAAADELLGRGSYSAWDCCAASGGKSILLHDINPSVRITASDIRESIIHNLKKRFASAGIRSFQTVLADLTKAPQPGMHELIVCDSPCTGSGTWSRTPEQLTFFNPEKIDYYRDLQQQILRGVAGNLSPGGCLVYSTCSVFARENEEVANWIGKELGLELLRSQYFTGYDQQADTLFAALFRKSS